MAPTPAKVRSLHISGEISTEVWQRLGRTLIPKLKTADDLRVGLDVSLSVNSDGANGLRQDIEQILEGLEPARERQSGVAIGITKLLPENLGNTSLESRLGSCGCNETPVDPIRGLMRGVCKLCLLDGELVKSRFMPAKM